MNTFNVVTTYLCCCNTDCTSLLSGTAIKAVVAYVCDYISKTGLSAYTAFDIIKQVLSKNSELIGGSNDHKTTACTLMIKMINALTAKMEMGSPMAAMWLSRKSKRTSEQQKQFNKYQERLNKNKQFTMDVDTSDIESYISNTMVNSIDELDMFQFSSDDEDQTQPPNVIKNTQCIEDDLSSDEILLRVDTYNECLTYDSHTDVPYIDHHPQYQTHHVRCIKDTDRIIPNFMNGSLPRRDHGDQEYYCLTMLVLFKPWRSGKDLKKVNQSWHESFNEYNFSDRQKQLMDNFNI